MFWKIKLPGVKIISSFKFFQCWWKFYSNWPLSFCTLMLPFKEEFCYTWFIDWSINQIMFCTFYSKPYLPIQFFFNKWTTCMIFSLEKKDKTLLSTINFHASRTASLLFMLKGFHTSCTKYRVVYFGQSTYFFCQKKSNK